MSFDAHCISFLPLLAWEKKESTLSEFASFTLGPWGVIVMLILYRKFCGIVVAALPYWHVWSDVLTLKMFWGGNHTDRIVANLIDRTQLRPILTAWPSWNLPGHLHSMMYSRRIFGTSMYYQHVYIYMICIYVCLCSTRKCKSTRFAALQYRLYADSRLHSF